MLLRWACPPGSVVLNLFLALFSVSAAAAGPAEDFFESKVRPVLVKNCYSCHTQTKLAGLGMNSRDDLLKGGKSGPALKPGDPDGSLLLQAVNGTHARLKMPPSGKLTDAEVSDLAAWIRDGAVWPEYKSTAKPATSAYSITPQQRSWWSFQPIAKPEPPSVKSNAKIASPIDRFIVSELEKRSLKPAPPTDRRTLIRRAYLDLTGLPPTPEEVDAFVKDNSADAWSNLIERLLASPRYGERWGRHWLDVARYADEKFASTEDIPYPSAWRYRDWVVQAFNDDMPYDIFVKAQLAGDQMPERGRYIAGLGLFALSPEQQDDRVDALSRGLLGLTVACAQCHDHKFDPIPTKDYYSLLGVFRSTRLGTHPLASPETVAEFKRHKEAADAGEKRLNDFLKSQADQLGEILTTQAAQYLVAVRDGVTAPEGLDTEILDRWRAYLSQPEQEHPFLKGWNEPNFDAEAFQAKLLAVLDEKRTIDRENLIALGGKDDDRTVRVVEVKSLKRDDYFLWRDFFNPGRVGKADSGVVYLLGKKIDRFLAPYWKQHADALRAEADRLKKAIPPEYPYLQVIEDVEKPANIRVEIRGSRDNLGEEAPRRFLQILSEGEGKLFTRGSGRLELAEAIADRRNPLTARVWANRVWLQHFGQGLVRTPGNFGQLGEKPSHPELLDYLAARLIEQGWSTKALHREIMMSAAYQRESDPITENFEKDPENRLLWRWSPRRLDVEPLRDTLLFVAGDLDAGKLGGPPLKLPDLENKRRTIYGSVSRRNLDGTLALFDFPNAVATSEQRILTATPLQQLFFLNSEFVQQRAESLAKRVQEQPTDSERIRQAYRLLFQRQPEKKELQLGLDYLKTASWPNYAQALLGSNELLFVN
jgi:mono/diheme cytochrome c family protein